MSAVIDKNHTAYDLQPSRLTLSEPRDNDQAGTYPSPPPGYTFDRGAASTELHAESHNVAVADTAENAGRRAIAARPSYRFQALKRWEGVVVSVDVDDFDVRLTNLDNPSEYQIEARIPMAEVMDGDHDLLEVGAVLYWTIGYRIEAFGQKSSVSTIRFRRLPMWTLRDRSRISDIAANYDAFFTENESSERK